MSRAKEWAFRALAAGFALLLFEGALRVLDLPRADTCWVPKEEYWLPDDALGFAYRPGASVAGGTINAIGLRGPVPDHGARPPPRRILFVGDSSVYGFGVADADTFWFRATASVAAAWPAEPIEPIVAAAPGYSSHHSLVLVERFAPYAPDWTVLYVGAYNDHRRRKYYADAAIPERMARRRASWHRVRTLQSGEFAANVFGAWLARNVVDPAENLRVPIAAFERNVTAMLDVANGAGARIVVLVPPFSEPLRARRPWISRYEAALREAAARAGAEVVELGPIFDTIGDAAFLRDGIHPSVAGHHAIAKAVAKAVLAAPPRGT
jgi:lysophospholipase L1-like esterase